MRREAARTCRMMMRLTLASLMGIALAFSSPLDNNDSMPRRSRRVMDDSSIRTAVAAWLSTDVPGRPPRRRTARNRLYVGD